MNIIPQLRRTLKLNSSRLSHYLLGIAITLIGMNTAFAQIYQDQQYQRQGVNYVTVYEDCDFRGKSRSLAIGNYNDIRRVDIGNDKISSIQVPSGLQVNVFKDENLRGDVVSFRDNVNCLSDRWNDEITSLQVVEANYTQDDRIRYGDANRPGPRVGAYGDQFDKGPNITRNVTRVWFGNTILKQGNDRLWRISNPNGTVDTFTEVSRTKRNIFLRNNGNGQAVQVDLQANNVRFVTPNGQHIDYAVSRYEKGKSRDNNNDTNKHGSSGVINGGCFSYRAYTRGGTGGIRFHGHDGFKDFGRKGASGKICHDGALTMEVSKKEAATEVIIDINGSQYRFGSNEQHDAYLNTWYRKSIKLRVNR